MLKILVSNIGFGQSSPQALKALKEVAQVSLNEKSIRYDEAALINLIKDADILIAGTEKISNKVLKEAKKLKLIARVGVGLDSVDLDAAKEHRISICYTPEAPAAAIPEFSLTLMLNAIKHISLIDRKMHQGQWVRMLGRSLSSLVIGVVGAGKIGSQVIKQLTTLYPNIIIYYYDPYVKEVLGAKPMSLQQLFKECDLVTIHTPLNTTTKNLVSQELLSSMKKGAFLINTSRGGIVDETALYDVLVSGHLCGAALDVFETEPYQGPLNQLDNCILTSHIGSMTQEVRALMEEEVVEDVIRFIKGMGLLRPVPGFNFK